MSERRLVTRLIVALGLLTALLGALLPTPAKALTASEFKITGVDPTYCTPYLHYIRLSNINDGGSGFDYYRLIIRDNTGQVDALQNLVPPTSPNPVTRDISFPFNVQKPAKTSTSITAYIYDQTTGDPNAPDGPLVAQTAAFSPLPASCGTTAPTPVTPTPVTPTPVTPTPVTPTPVTPTPVTPTGPTTPGVTAATVPTSVPDITYYPPDNRTMAYIRVDTPVYIQPNISSQTVGTLRAGQTWFVTTLDPTGKFWQVFLGGPNLGWAKASDITVSGASNPAPSGGSSNSSNSGTNPTAQPPGIQTVPKGTVVGIINTSHLHLHASGSISSPSIGIANAGERYILLGRLAGQTWVKVTGPAGTGWANSFYMILSAPLSRVPVITG